jgi:hypothetical protein
MADGTAAYDERYQWTATTSYLLLGCLAFIVPMVLLRPPLILEILVVGMFGWMAVYTVATVFSFRVAFRVDERGVTFGGGPFRYRSSTRFFPWDDIEAIVLWKRYVPFMVGRWTLFKMGPIRYIGLQRHAGARAIRRGGRGLADRPAYLAPVRGIAAGAAYNITTWVLDPDRLGEAVAVFAPTVRIDAGATVMTTP